MTKLDKDQLDKITGGTANQAMDAGNTGSESGNTLSNQNEDLNDGDGEKEAPTFGRNR